MEKRHHKIWIKLIILTLLISIFLPVIDAKEIMLGITQNDGAKYNVEFIKYSKLSQFYKANEINAALLDFKIFYENDISTKHIFEKLKKYNVVILRTRAETISHLTPEYIERAKNVSKALVQYVKQGGGLIIQPRSVRYPGCRDEEYWNIVFKDFGLQILHEGIFDKENQAEDEIKPNKKHKFFYTENIKEHPITKNSKGFWLPMTSFYPNAGTPAIKYSSDWEILVKGEASAKSYKSHEQRNILDLNEEGLYKSEPPIIACRKLGKGRVVCISVDRIHTGMNYKTPAWSHIVEDKGKNGKSSDMMQLMLDSVKWASESSRGNDEFGTFKLADYEPVKFPESCSFDNINLDETEKGIIGAHSSYSDGENSVQEYADAAKDAGLSFIVFTDPLELLTPEKFEALKKDCKTASGKRFYACPGIEFSDGNGIRWIFLGEKVKWPIKSFKRKGQTYELWDGERINHYGQFSELCARCPSAVIDYNQLRKAGAVPENMWWFYNVIPYSYDRDKLIADNTDELLFALRDIRWLIPISFTRIKSSKDVGLAKKTSFTGIKNLYSVKKLLNTKGSPYHKGRAASEFVSFGGDVSIDLKAVNAQMEQNWQHTKGAQRVKIKFTAESSSGIKEVKVYDANYGLLRRFIAPKDNQIFSRSFELVHDKQHWLIMEAIDNKGAKAFSSSLFLYCYKQGLARCSDNLNILGPLGMYWHPDRNQMLSLFKDFRNAEQISVQGWDRGGPDCLRPEGELCDFINIKGIGKYPYSKEKEYLAGKRMNIKLASHNIQVVEMKMDSLVERFGNQNRPGPAFCSIAKKVADNEYFDRVDRMIAPMDRMDHFVAWNYRRLYESIKDYQGSYVWHEGEFKFKKDVVLQGDVPIPLARMSTPFNFENKLGTILIVKDSQSGIVKQEINKAEEKFRLSGGIAPGGFVAHMNSPVGYLGTLVPQGNNLVYKSSLPGELVIGLGKDGQKIKAGTVLKYAFLTGDFIDQANNADRMKCVSKAFNMKGGTDGYPVEMKIGSLKGATFFFHAQADKNEAEFVLGPQTDIGIDLPIKIEGLEDNGCAAVYSSYRKWFRFIPVVDNVAYFQEPIDSKNNIWIGNVFVCDNKDVKITLIKEGQNPNKPPFIEVHNPTGKTVNIKVWSPENTPLFGGRSYEMKLAPGTSSRQNL
jgi:hypothetical protein